MWPDSPGAERSAEAVIDGSELPRTRIPPQSDETSIPQPLWQSLFAYLGERCWVGRIKLTHVAHQREAHIWTLDDGEHLILLMLGKELCHWGATRASWRRLHKQACDWLCEPAEQP